MIEPAFLPLGRKAMRVVAFQFAEYVGDIRVSGDLRDDVKMIRHGQKQHGIPPTDVLSVYACVQQGLPCIGIIEVMNPSSLMAEGDEQWVILVDPLGPTVTKGIPGVEGHAALKWRMTF